MIDLNVTILLYNPSESVMLIRYVHDLEATKLATLYRIMTAALGMVQRHGA